MHKLKIINNFKNILNEKNFLIKVNNQKVSILCKLIN